MAVGIRPAAASLRARFERGCPSEGGGVRHSPEVPVPTSGTEERWRPHNSTLTDLRRQTPKFRAVVWQPDPATGLGNSLQGSTSAYLYSLFSGRELFVGRTTMTETLCTAFDCGFTLVSLPREEWADQSKCVKGFAPSLPPPPRSHHRPATLGTSHTRSSAQSARRWRRSTARTR